MSSFSSEQEEEEEEDGEAADAVWMNQIGRAHV